MARAVWVATGIAWSIRSFLELFGPEYFDPAVAIDYAAVWSYTIALSLTAVSVTLLARLAPSRVTGVIAGVTAAGGGLAAAANVLEDAFAVHWMGTTYLAGFLIMWGGLLALVISTAVSGYRRIAVLFLVLFAGVALVATDLGGFILLVGLCAVAIRPEFFAKRFGPASKA